MRKFVICFLLFIPILSFAQTENSGDKQIFVGFIGAGMNASQIAGDRMAGYKKVGANVGVGSFIKFKENWSTSVELNYTMKGSQSSFKKNDPANYSKFKFDYAAIPVMFNYHEEKIAIFQAGVTFARLIKSDLYDAQGLIYADDVKNWDFSASVGVIFLVKEKIGLGLRGNFSINSLLEVSDPFSRARKSGWYHNSLSFKAYYLFVKKEN